MRHPCLYRKYLFDMVFGLAPEPVKITPCFSEYVCELLTDISKESNKPIADDDHLSLGLVHGVTAAKPTRKRGRAVHLAELNKGPCREILCRKILQDSDGNIPLYPEAPCFQA